MLEVKIKLLEGGTLPTKRDEDAYYDVVARSINITPQYIEYGLGFCTEFNNTIEGVIVPRSSLSNYDLVQSNHKATMDSGYRGEWMVRFKATFPTEAVMNISDPTIAGKYENWKPKIYNVGDKIAQITFKKLYDIQYTEVNELSDSERGDGSYGSTGN